MPDADSYSDQMTATLALCGANIESFAEAFPSDHASAKETSHCRNLLIDTMQLVEPSCSVDLPVPNHLLDTKLYCKVAENGMIKVSPAVVHFAGFEPCRQFIRKLKLQNMSTDMQHMHIIPPQTKYFSIKYTKKERLAPGFSLSCTIEFCPDEWRYYYDCVRIHCKDEKNLVIPIHGYPVMKTSEFPQLIDFPAVPLGETKTKVFPLRCHAPIDFEFQLTILQCSPAFEVEPMAGTVPGCGEVEIRVSFHPTSFCSATMKMQLEISQYLALPLICTVNGCCFPGMKRNILLAKDRSLTFDNSLSSQRMLDPMMISPVERAHCRKLKMKTPRIFSAVAESESEKQIVECDGLRIPVNLDNPHAVGVVLNQKPGKLRVKDLRSNLLGAQVQSAAALTRQMKEAMFDMATRKDAHEERQNQLRWQVKLGKDAVSADCCISVLAERKEAEEIYKVHLGELDENDECTRTVAKLSWKRTRRLASWVAPPVATFDALLNDLWLSRHMAIQRFQQAARKVIIRLRVKPRLVALRQLQENPNTLEMEEEPTCATEVVKLDNEHEASCQNIAKISSVTFPVFLTEGVRNEQHPGLLTLKPVEVKLNEKVPYLALKVPQQYKLLGYRPFSIQDASSNYISTNLARPLRTGAEDELIDLGLPEMSKGGSAIQISTSGTESEVTPLVAPKAMLHPIKYSALHIFNPVPGIMTFQNHLPYSETDPDFHLCTLPRFFSTNTTSPHMATQKQYLTREEIIRGVMTWKKFPSPSIASLTGAPTLTNVWVPRWSDPFSQELLPYDVPDLFDSVAEDDKLVISMQSGVCAENEIQLTPQMVSAEFAAIDVNCKTDEELKDIKSEILAMSVPESDRLPSNNLPFGENGPITRDEREANLNQLLKKKLGLLGQRIHSRMNHIESLRKKKMDPNN